MWVKLWLCPWCCELGGGPGRGSSCPRLIDESLGGAGISRSWSPEGWKPRPGLLTRIRRGAPQPGPGQSPVLILPNSVALSPRSLERPSGKDGVSGLCDRFSEPGWDTLQPCKYLTPHRGRSAVANGLGGRRRMPSALEETHANATSEDERVDDPAEPRSPPSLTKALVLPAARGSAGTAQLGRETPALELVNLRRIARMFWFGATERWR